MRSPTRILLVSAVMFAAACGRGEKKQANGLSDDLSSDLALASSSLAYPDLKVIAPEEQGPKSTPKRASAPKRESLARRAAPPVRPNEPSSETAVEVAVAAKASDVDEAEPVPETAEPVIASPRPTPMPVSYPGDRGDIGGGRPTVVIRGGSAGEDHCEIHNGRRPRTVILINNRMPPIGVPTFPGGGIPINPLGTSARVRIR